MASLRTGAEGVRRSDGRRSEEGLAFAAVGGDLVGDLVAVDEVEAGEAFAQFAGFGVPEPDPVADAEVLGRLAEEGVWTSPAPSSGS